MTQNSYQAFETVEIPKNCNSDQGKAEDNSIFSEIHQSSSIVKTAKLLMLLLKGKKVIYVTTLVVTILSVAISFLLPEYFVSTSVLLPETASSKLAGLGNLTDLASMAGVSTGEVSPVKLYPTIIMSETILKPVIYHKYQTKEKKDSINLIDYWNIQVNSPAIAYETALRILREKLEVSTDIKTSILTLTIETTDPQLSADIINGVTAELDKFMRTKRTTNATKQRQWIETRLSEVKQDLAVSENRMREFRERNRVIAGSPLLILEQDRLLREVQINSSLFSELKKQYELIRIEEIKNIPIVNVLDPASPAAKKSKPKRSIIILTMFFVALIGSSSYIYLKDTHSKNISQFVALWKQMMII